MLVTLATLVAFRNDAVGFMAGMLCHYSYRLPAVWARWTEHGLQARRSRLHRRRRRAEDEEGLLSRRPDDDDDEQ
jgi:hypothetical protein